MFKVLKKIFTTSARSDRARANIATTPDQSDLSTPQNQRIIDTGIEREQGNRYLAEGRLDDAARCYATALSINACDTGSLINLAYVLQEQGRDADAEQRLLKVFEFEDDNIDAIFMLGNVSQRLGKTDLALTYFNEVLTLEPGYDIAYRALLNLHRYDEAVERCDVELQIDPQDVAAMMNRGIALQAMNRPVDALIDFDRAIHHMPSNPEAHYHAGASLTSIGKLELAAQRYRQAIELKSDYMEAYNNLGTVLLVQNRYQEALASFDQSLHLMPNSANAYLNQGTALLNLRRYDDALASWKKATQIKPDLAEAHFNASQCKLQMGDFESGWRTYEWRWRRTTMRAAIPQFGNPLWLGKESLVGKVILLHPEQGLGDTIQFCRLAKQVADLGATVLLVAPQPLRELLSGLAGVSQLLAPGDILPSFDFHCPLLSLPLALGITVANIPADVPYLNADSELVVRMRDAIGETERIKIGVCWKGGASYVHDANRSPGIEPFKKFMSGFIGSQIAFYTLLPDSRELFSSIGGEDIGHELDSATAPFAETAALISNLDLVITCDTSIGHLAGALGKAVWLVLPYSTDWRWIIHRDDSPWYPQTRLFRQEVAGDWNELFERVSARLTDVLDGSSQMVWTTAEPQAEVKSIEHAVSRTPF